MPRNDHPSTTLLEEARRELREATDARSLAFDRYGAALGSTNNLHALNQLWRVWRDACLRDEAAILKFDDLQAARYTTI